MKRVIVVTGALFALVPAIAAVVFYVRVWPWIAEPGDPAELAARWAEVESWAARPPASLGPEATAFRDALRAGSLQSDQVPAPGDDFSLPTIELERLPEDVRKMVDALLVWHDSGAPLARGCLRDSERLPALRALHVGRIAIASATEPGDRRLAAALRLAAELRTGGTLLEGGIGATLAHHAAATAASRGFAASESFSRYRPAKREPFVCLAREYVCTQEWLESELRLGGRGGSPLDRVDRELRMMRAWHSERLHGVASLRDDPRELARNLQPVTQETLPKSLLVRMVAIDEAATMKDWAEAIDTFDAFVGAPP